MDEKNFPADWAIERALSASVPAARSNVWTVRHTKSEYAEGMAWAFTVIELARMIEKYEPHLAPVDPDVLAVREILAAMARCNGSDIDARKWTSGKYDTFPSFTGALAAYRKVVAARG